ncbi:DUF3102 domain-containing protein [Streptococcus gordonii]|uniref:DUF3102 domain-containing protein n=1 Tax=Streptococcus gordonii TaxID=1302 RepID=UPI000F66BFAF|nr:DUF3102 domain-containing protein [Streptococcus gordonii]RSJ46664.1 hypothetical protein D8815_08560 [Streptococcus gordonii]RSJ49671.1 hypothetical protein D8816_00905 [Streptococcus gordonii]
MNEIALSNNLSQIELEINHHKNIAGQSIWEIGRRLNHVKENDLAHGEFRNWHERLGLDKDFAYKSMKIAKELPNVETLRHLGTTALHLIATLPEEERKHQINRIEQGDSLTVRELQTIKKKYSKALGRIAELEASEPQPKEVVKEVIKEVRVTPPDYQEAIQKARESEAYAERNAFLEQQLNQMSEQRDKANKYDDIERAIEQGRGQLNEQQKEIASTKEAIAFLKKGNQFLANFGGVAYLDIQSVLPKNAQLRVEVETFASQLKILLDDVNTILGQSRNEILEGEIL